MNCKNCGARVSDNAKVCPNCGAMMDENEGYVLLTDDTAYEDYYPNGRQTKTKKKGAGVRWFLSILLTLAIIGGGAYYYFEYIYEKPVEAPAVTFEGGAGIINGDEKIIYVTIENGSNIEYIHGVTLFNATADNTEKIKVTDQYQYTKSINDSFRAIFFDVDESTMQKANVYTFEIRLSFNGNDEIYTYTPSVSFPGEITEDVSDIIFDHSVEESTTGASAEESTTQAAETTTKAASTGDITFIGETYWFSDPEKDGDKLTIYAYKFNDGGKYTATRYYKDGSKDWEITTKSGTYDLSDYSLTVDGNEYLIDTANKALESDTGKKLTARKYNSVKNAEDFFGI